MEMKTIGPRGGGGSRSYSRDHCECPHIVFLDMNAMLYLCELKAGSNQLRFLFCFGWNDHERDHSHSVNRQNSLFLDVYT